MSANAVKMSNKLQVVLHVRHVLKHSEENLVEPRFSISDIEIVSDEGF